MHIRTNPIKIGILFPVLLLFLVLLFLRDFVKLGIPSFLFLGLALLVALIGDKTELITFCICCIPALNAFQSKYALLCFMAIYMIRFGKKQKVPIIVWLTILMLYIWELLHGFISLHFSLIESLRLFTEIFFCAFLVSCSVEDIDFKKIIRAFSWVTICVCTIILLVQLKDYSYRVDLLFSGVFRFGYGGTTENLSVGFNPNILAFICLTAIETEYMLVYKKQGVFSDLVAITLLCVFGLLTMSKKFIICGLLLIFFVLYTQRNRKSRTQSIFLLILLIAIAYVILSYFFPSVIGMIQDRFDTNDLTTGRVDIFSFYNKQLFTSNSMLIFGVGLQDYGDKLNLLYPGASIPHNGEQELLVTWGIFGLVVFIVFLLAIIKRSRINNSNICFVNYIPLIIYMVYIQAAQMVSSSVTIMLLAVVYICLNINLFENAENKLND